MISVVVADDQAIFRAGLCSLLESDPGLQVVAEAEDGAQAVAAVRRHDPDVVLMDVRMPRMDGIAATLAIRESGARARVLILTTFDLDEYVFGALRAGASGFLVKDAGADVLFNGIRTVVAGEGLLAPSAARRLIEAFAASAPPNPDMARRIQALTAREVEVLRHLAGGASNSEIAGALVLSAATVKSHVHAILSKLELRDRVQAVVFAYESGLVARRA